MGTITHAKVSTIADDPAAVAAGEVVPSNWNAQHNFSLTSSDVGLGNVDNTSDANKPVSTAQATAIATAQATAISSAATAAAVLYRPKLAANQTKNVPSDYATLQLALAYAATIDFNGFTLTLQLATGSYAGRFDVPVTVGQAASANLLIQGDTATPSNVVLTGAFSFAGILKVDAGARCRVQGVQFQGSGNTFGIHAVNGGICEMSLCDFNTGMFFHRCGEADGAVNSVGNYTISAGATAHLGAVNGGFTFDVGQTITLSNTPGISRRICVNQGLSFSRISGCTFSGTGATGQRYQVDSNSMVQTDGGGATALPGNAPGATSSGGIYQ